MRLRSVSNVFAVCFKCVCDVSAGCLRCVCGVFQVCLLCVCGVFQVCLQCVSDVCFRCVCNVFAVCFRCVCGVSKSTPLTHPLAQMTVYRSPRKHPGGPMSHPGSTRDTQEPPRGPPRRHPGGIRSHRAPSGHRAGTGEPKCIKSVQPSSFGLRHFPRQNPHAQGGHPLELCLSPLEPLSQSC